MTKPAVPERIGRVLDVESGLNGVTTAVVTLAIAIAEVTLTKNVQVLAPIPTAVTGLDPPEVGVIVGLGGSRPMRAARRYVGSPTTARERRPLRWHYHLLVNRSVTDRVGCDSRTRHELRSVLQLARVD
jgi:hypothetical protein